MEFDRVLCVLFVAALSAACGSDDGGDEGSGGSAGSSGASGSGGSAGSAGSSGASGSGGTGGSTSAECTDVVGQCQTAGGASCHEYGGTRGSDTVTSLEENCKQAQNTWASGACTLTGAIGTCVFDFGAGAPCSAIVYYPPSDEATAKSTCEGSQGTWKTP